MMSTRSLLALCSKVFTVVLGLGLAVAFTLTSVPVARAQDNDNFDELRAQAVEWLGSGWTESARVSRQALLENNAKAWQEYRDNGIAKANREDLESFLRVFIQLGSTRVSTRANELSASNADATVIEEFLNQGWQALYAQDNRDQVDAWVKESAADSRVARLGRAALDQGDDSIEAFVNGGHAKALAADQQRQMYALLDSPFESVRSQANEVLSRNDPGEIAWFLEHGQFVAQAQGKEQQTVEDFVEAARVQSDIAVEQSRQAADHARKARQATESAKRAMERAQREAEIAKNEASRASTLADKTAELAAAAGRNADIAVAAAADAHAAMLEAADAMAATALSASLASQAATNASNFANQAKGNRDQAQEIRDRAWDAKQQAQRAMDSLQHLDWTNTLMGYAQETASQSQAAADNAQWAYEAAQEAGKQAGLTSEQAQRARDAATRAGESARRARSAANTVSSLVGQIRGLVGEIQACVERARQAAQRAFDAAVESANYAQVAHREAELAKANAEAAQQAAESARAAMDAAGLVRELRRNEAVAAVKLWEDSQRTQAVDSRLQDANQLKKLSQSVTLREGLERDFEELRSYMPTVWAQMPTGSPEGLDWSRIWKGLTAAASLDDPYFAGAAQEAVRDGSEDAFWAFAERFEELDEMSKRNHVVALMSAYRGNEGVVQAGNAALAGELSDVESFIATGFGQAVVPSLREDVQGVRKWANEREYRGVKAKADEALADGSYEALNNFLSDGFDSALRLDQQKRLYQYLDLDEGSEVRAGAQAALEGGRTWKEAFFNQGLYYAQAADRWKDTHDARVDSLMSTGWGYVAQAQQAASLAMKSYYEASHDAAKASEYAAKASGFANDANESFRVAEQKWGEAKANLAKALEYEKTAQGAAASASADAAKAGEYAAQATVNEQSAWASFDDARKSAEDASKYAREAGEFAEEVSGWYQEEFKIQQGLDVANLEGAAASGDFGDIASEVWNTLKDEFGEEAVNLIKDVLGVTDILNCMKGDTMGCLMTAVNLLPIGKIWKAAKALPLISKMAGKMGDVVRAVKTARARKLADAGMCTVPAGRAGRQGVRRAAAGCKIGTFLRVKVDRFNGGDMKLFKQLNFEEKVPLKDWDVKKAFFPKMDDLELNKLKEMGSNQFKAKMRELGYDDLGFSSFNELEKGLDSLKLKIVEEPVFESNKLFQATKGMWYGLTDKLGEARHLSSKGRVVGKDPLQNELVQDLASNAKRNLDDNYVRIDQREVSRTGEKLEPISTGRPDLVVAKEKVTFKYEFGSFGSGREMAHIYKSLKAAQQAREKNPAKQYVEEWPIKVEMPRASYVRTGTIRPRGGDDQEERTFTRFCSEQFGERKYAVTDTAIFEGIGTGCK